jgi:hypothetical protein
LRIACLNDEFTFRLDYRYLNYIAGFYFRQRRFISSGLQAGQKVSYSFFFTL